MYLGISIAFAVAACAEAILQARKAQKLRRTLEDNEEQLVSWEVTAKSMENERNELSRVNQKLRNSLADSENAACTLRRSLQEARAELRLEKDEHERATKELSEARAEVEELKSARNALEAALIREKETSEHWKDEHKKEYYARLTTEGRVSRELSNIFNYCGSGRGQEDLNADEY